MEPHGLAGVRVLVTGATGFIGQRLVERLVVQERADVRILARTVARAKPLARFPLDVRIGDVTDPAAVETAVADCAVVVNCAKGAGADPAARRAVDVDGVRNVLAAAGRTGARRVVHVSTVAVHELPVTGEYDERAPLSVSKEPYVAGKRDGHRLALDTGRTGRLPVSVVQPTVVYGPGASIYGRDIIDELRTSRVPLVDGGSGTCNAVFVDDVVSGIMLAATAERAPGEAFILSGPAPVTWNAFYGAFSAMLGADSTVSVSPEQALQQWKESARRPWLVPEWLRSVRQDAVLRDRLLSTREGNLVRRAAFRVLPDAYFEPERWQPPAPADDAEPPLATFRPDVIARLSSRAVASTRKARELLGYEPLFDLGAGMRVTEAWARAEGLLPAPDA